MCNAVIREGITFISKNYSTVVEKFYLLKRYVRWGCFFLSSRIVMDMVNWGKVNGPRALPRSIIALLTLTKIQNFLLVAALVPSVRWYQATTKCIVISCTFHHKNPKPIFTKTFFLNETFFSFLGQQW